MLEWVATTDLHPLIASCVFHYEFEFVRPFAEGKGRVGRLRHTLLLAKWRPILDWIPTERAIAARRADYYAAFRRANAAGSSETFVEFALEAMHEALLPFARPDATPSPEDSVLELFSANPTASIDALAAHLGLPKRSVERLTARLRASGRLVRAGGPRAGSWRVVDETGTGPPNNENALSSR